MRPCVRVGGETRTFLRVAEQPIERLREIANVLAREEPPLLAILERVGNVREGASATTARLAPSPQATRSQRFRDGWAGRRCRVSRGTRRDRTSNRAAQGPLASGRAHCPSYEAHRRSPDASAPAMVRRKLRPCAFRRPAASISTSKPLLTSMRPSAPITGRQLAAGGWLQSAARKACGRQAIASSAIPSRAK